MASGARSCKDDGRGKERSFLREERNSKSALSTDSLILGAQVVTWLACSCSEPTASIWLTDNAGLSTTPEAAASPSASAPPPQDPPKSSAAAAGAGSSASSAAGAS